MDSLKTCDMLLKLRKDINPNTNNKTITQQITKTIERKIQNEGIDEKILRLKVSFPLLLLFRINHFY